MKFIILKPHEVRCLQDKGEVLVVRALPKQPGTDQVIAGNDQDVFSICTHDGTSGFQETRNITCPFGVAGEKRWVKETFSSDWDGKRKFRWVHYKSDMTARQEVLEDHDKRPMYEQFFQSGCDKFKSPYFMPQWASRFTIENTRIECRQVQSISEDEAKMSGIAPVGDGWKAYDDEDGFYAEPVNSFDSLWESQHKKPPLDWGSNPYAWFVWVKRVEC